MKIKVIENGKEKEIEIPEDSQEAECIRRMLKREENEREKRNRRTKET